MDMDESQTLILETLQRVLADWQAQCGHAPSPADAEAFWAEIGKIGLLGALAPESAGGLGEDGRFVFEFLREWGQAAAPGPVISTLVGGSALLLGTSNEVLLDGIAEGSVRLALPAALNAPGHFPDIASGQSGQASIPAVSVLRDGGFASHAILPVRIGDDVALICVGMDRLSVSAPFQLVDGASAVSLAPALIPVSDTDILARGADAEIRWLAASERMTAAISCEAVGLLRTMLQQTVDYVRQRVQFGKPIGSNQAIQHRLADMMVDVEQAHSLALAAMSASGNPMRVSAAKARVNRSLQYVADQAVQLHGGIGTTQELSLNRFFRRAMAIAREFGSTGQHLSRVEAELLARMTSPETIA